MRRAARTETVRAVDEVRLEDRLQHQQHRCLHDPILDGRDAKRSLPAVRLGYVDALYRLRPIAAGAKLIVQLLQECRRAGTINDVLARLAIHAGSALVLQHQPPGSGQHVVPIHPVVQGVKPESRLSLGLAAQLPPELRDVQRQHDPRFHLRLGRRLLGIWSCRLFRSGTNVQAGLSSVAKTQFSAGVLRSAGVTRFLRYYDPLRLPPSPGSRLCLPAGCWRRSPDRQHADGSLRFLNGLSPSAVLSHPEELDRCVRSLLHDRCWLRHCWQVGRSHFVTGPKQVHFCVTADGFAFRGFGARVTPDAARSATGVRAIPRTSSFQLVRSSRLLLTHQRAASSPFI